MTFINFFFKNFNYYENIYVNDNIILIVIKFIKKKVTFVIIKSLKTIKFCS